MGINLPAVWNLYSKRTVFSASREWRSRVIQIKVSGNGEISVLNS